MAFSYIQSNFASASDPNALAFGSNVASSSLLIGAVYWSSSSATCSVSDNRNGAWTAVGSPLTGAGDLANLRLQLFYYIGAQAGATTVTADISSSVSCGFAIHEYSGASPQVDGTPTSNQAVASDPTTTAITTTQSGSMLFGACVNFFAVSSVDAPATIRQIDFGTADITNVGAAGPYSISFNTSHGDNVLAAIAFKEASSTSATVSLTNIRATGSAAVVAPPRPRPAHPYSEINLRM